MMRFRIEIFNAVMFVLVVFMMELGTRSSMFLLLLSVLCYTGRNGNDCETNCESNLPRVLLFLSRIDSLDVKYLFLDSGKFKEEGIKSFDAFQ